MKKFIIIAFSILATILFLNCGGKDFKKIESLKTYEDPAVHFALKYPANWIKYETPSLRFLCYSDQSVKLRYPRYEPIGGAGGKIEVLIVSLDSTQTIDSVLMNGHIFEKTTYSPPEKVIIDGVNGLKESYGFELEDGTFYGERYVATKDNKLATVINFEAFANTWEFYQKDFEEILKSVKLAVKPAGQIDTINQTVEADPPSSSLRTVDGDGYSIQIPDNFSSERGLYIGQRRGDSYIKVDVFNAAKTQDLDKLVNENKKKLPGAGQVQDVNINGEKAKKVFYKPTGKISGEMYFILKNKKLYRVTINWYSADKEEEKLFKPILQKCVSTLSIK